MRVLLVEDEPRLSATLSRGLKAEGFVVVAASTGVEGLHEAVSHNFDVVVLDIMLPGHSGVRGAASNAVAGRVDTGAHADCQGR